MSLESAIERLAIATENNAAVREIIRQRDEAIKELAKTQQWLKYARDDRDQYQRDAQNLRRRNIALRGAITRMKRKSAIEKGSE